MLSALLSKVFKLEKYVANQVSAALVHVPASLATYPFKAKTSSLVKIANEKTGGFIKGICHAGTGYSQIKSAGIEWHRTDIPFPFDENGAIRDEYINYKNASKDYVENGFKIMAVTPYPYEYIRFGVDPRKPENEKQVKDIAEFFMHDLSQYVSAFQISNELGVPRFVLPLTAKEAVRFMGLHLEAMYPLRKNILIGYNNAGPQADINKMMKPYHRYCDYVGIDIYVGCFKYFNKHIRWYDIMLDYLWSFTNKPIILCEFGYISGGAPKTAEEKRNILQRYGADDESEARQNINAFIEKLPEKMKNRILENASGNLADFIFKSDFSDHFYSELPARTMVRGYPHTPEGQADFYRLILPKLMKKPYLLGAFIYCYADSHECYVCGQNDCPVETKWGLTATDGKEKPAYYAVSKIWNNH